MKTNTKHMNLTFVALAAMSLNANAALVIPIATTASSQITAAPRQSINTINGSGLSGTGLATDTHGSNSDHMWLTAGSITASGFGNGGIDYNPIITFNLGAATNVGTVRIWNFNEVGYTKHGVQMVTISGSTDGTNFTQTMAPVTFAQAGGTGSEPAQEFFSSFTDVTHIRFTVNTNWDGDNFDTDTFAGSAEQFAGLSEVRFDTIPEPSAALLGGLSLLGLLRRRR